MQRLKFFFSGTMALTLAFVLTGAVLAAGKLRIGTSGFITSGR